MMSTTEGELDIEVTQEREDGEIENSDFEEGTYIPLARPETFDPPSLVHMQIQDDQSDDGSVQESSGSESDEEPRRRAKRSKTKVRRSESLQNPLKKEKYNVWCKALQDEVLTEDMVSCDLSRKFRYGVESYDYTIKYRLKDDDYASKKVFGKTDEINKEYPTNKRRHSDRSNVKLRLGKRVNNHHKKEEKSLPRILPDLSVTVDDSTDTVGVDIAEKLQEEKKDLLVKIVGVLGTQKAMDLYKQTQRVEADGGMLIMNGIRRRTPGGVYFFLLKRDDDVSQEMINIVFNEDKKETARRIKRARAKSRQQVVEQLKQSLTDCELPSLMSRSEVAAPTEHGSNPPPSPATDARDCSSDTDAPAESRPAPGVSPPPAPRPPLVSPHREHDDDDDDDYLEVMCNEDMDLF